ncbi:hypothetical protein Dda_5251 [Drechslerella dactyloides]|uniref:Uncharacterized protein n=1 Tax=Drechslerella dactyloides TaxID=74499 RepID=A0AAD6NK16_DREDA|nr:hypothetical protein Dda_5251 [Drechslerella dactyloides]
MASNDDNKWRRRQSSQSNSSSPGPSSSQSFNQPRRNDSRSDRGSSSFGRPQDNRHYSSGNPNIGSMMEEHSSVNNFNGKDVRDFLSRGYQEMVNAAQASGDNKPVVFKQTDKGWVTQSKSSPWAPNKHVMANGTDFLTRVKKGVASSGANGTGKDGKIGG